ncbi:MAG: DUF134 domain-containing protein [Candidatus Izemoplasmatales bacterium]|jgi:predicted DNA-binding protein (UPF0251 family)|nr:DUF134 domain-containing protein [Candidatus Izemoplasmatales bacterium]
MPRPPKPRIICHQPKYLVYGPKGIRANSSDKLTMMIDELETIRLIDYLGYTQEEAAEQMAVARTTVQRIYNDARKKVATSLIDGKIIVIEGGEYTLCEEDCEKCLEPLRLRRRGGGGGRRNF